MEREQLRFGRFVIAKAHVAGRRYRAVVLDMDLREGGDAVGPHPKVYRAQREGWTKQNRDECRGWIALNA